MPSMKFKVKMQAQVPPTDGAPVNLTNDMSSISVSTIKESETIVKEPNEPELGMSFESDEAAKRFYNEYERRLGFPFRVGRSRRSKGAEEVKRFVCSKEGVYRKKQSGEANIYSFVFAPHTDIHLSQIRKSKTKKK